MRRYVIALVVMAVLIGSLFRASEQTGVRLMNMFATLGVFLFGVVGTLALTRWQSREGVKSVEQVLKSLEPDWVITDWAFRGGERPDYLLVGPGGVVAVCLEETPQSAWKSRARNNAARARQRAHATVRWLQEHLSHSLDGTGNVPADLPVAAVVLLTRRRAEPEYTGEGVPVLNPDSLGEHVRSIWDRDLLGERTRFQVTRALRSG